MRMTRISVAELLGEEEPDTAPYDVKSRHRRVGSRRDGNVRSTAPPLAGMQRHKMRVEFLVRGVYTGYQLPDKEGLHAQWRFGPSKFPKMVRWPLKLSWKIFQRDMAKNCRCDAYYYDDEGRIHEIFTEEDFRKFLQKAAGKQEDGQLILLNILPIKQSVESAGGPLRSRSSSGNNSHNNSGKSHSQRHKKLPDSEKLMASATSALEALVASWKLQPSSSPAAISASGGQPAKEPQQVARALQLPDCEETGATSINTSSAWRKLLRENERCKEPLLPDCLIYEPSTSSSCSSSSSSAGGSCLAGSKSPVSSGIMRQQASVFDWMADYKKKEKPPAWFTTYMEAYKDDLVSEITAKVVNSLGIVVEGKLAQQQQQQEVLAAKKDSKTQTHARTPNRKLDYKKAKKDAVRISMENSGLDQELSGSTSPRRSVKHERMVKVAMKMEKKETSNTHHHHNMAEYKMAKAEKMAAKAERWKTKAEYKMAKAEKKMAQVTTELAQKQPLRKVETADASSVVASKNAAVIIDIAPPPPPPTSALAIKPSVIYPVLAVPSYPLAVLVPPPPPLSALFLPQRPSAPAASAVLPGISQIRKSSLLPAAQAKGYAVYLPDGASQDITEAKPGTYYEASVKVVNMGLAWASEDLTLQRMFSSAGLVSSHASSRLLPRLPSGGEANVRFGFLVPSAPSGSSASGGGSLESVWRFYAGSQPFGPMLRFRFFLPQDKENKEEIKQGAKEMKEGDISKEKENLVDDATEWIASECIRSVKIVEISDWKANTESETYPEVKEDVDPTQLKHDDQTEEKDESLLPVGQEDDADETLPCGQNDKHAPRAAISEEPLVDVSLDSDEIRTDDGQKKSKTEAEEEEDDEEEGFEHVALPDCFKLNVPFVMVSDEKAPSIETAILEASLDDDLDDETTTAAAKESPDQ